MASVNLSIIIGNVGNDPTTNTLPNGDMVANFSVATSENWKDKQGQKQEKTQWHRMVCYRKLAEIVEAYVRKGSSVYCEGKIEYSIEKSTDVVEIKDLDLEDTDIEDLLDLFDENDVYPYMDKDSDDDYDDYYDEDENDEY